MKKYKNDFHLKRFVLGILLMISTTVAMAAEPVASSSMLNELFGVINSYLAAVFFYDVMPGEPISPS